MSKMPPRSENCATSATIPTRSKPLRAIVPLAIAGHSWTAVATASGPAASETRTALPLVAGLPETVGKMPAGELRDALQTLVETAQGDAERLPLTDRADGSMACCHRAIAVAIVLGPLTVSLNALSIVGILLVALVMRSWL